MATKVGNINVVDKDRVDKLIASMRDAADSDINTIILKVDATQKMTVVLVNSGSYTMEEITGLVDHNSINYILYKVHHGDGRIKFCYIYWAGEKVTSLQKARAGGIFNDVKDYFGYTHVVLQANDIGELTQENLDQKLAKAGGASYSSNTSSGDASKVPAPVLGAHAKKLAVAAAASATAGVAAGKRQETVEGTSVPFTMDGNVMRVENQHNVPGTVELKVTPHMSLKLVNCSDCVFSLANKVNLVSITESRHVVLRVTSCINSVDVLNSDRVTVQIAGHCPTANVEKSTNIEVALGTEALDTDVITSFSDCVSVSSLNSQKFSFLVPTQFVHKVHASGLKLVSSPVEHI